MAGFTSVKMSKTSKIFGAITVIIELRSQF